MSVSTTVKKYGIEQAIKFMYKDPEKNLPKLMDWADTFCKGRFPGQRAAIRRAIEDPTYPYYDFIRHMMNEVDHDVLTTIVVNFFINANMVGCEKQEKLREEHNCNIPWAILLDPTSACNLHCTGCWAAEYGNKLNLTFDEIDDIIRQGKDMGVYMSSTPAANLSSARPISSSSAKSTTTASFSPLRTARSSTKSSPTIRCA